MTPQLINDDTLLDQTLVCHEEGFLAFEYDHDGGTGEMDEYVQADLIVRVQVLCDDGNAPCALISMNVKRKRGPEFLVDPSETGMIAELITTDRDALEQIRKLLAQAIALLDAQPQGGPRRRAVKVGR